MTAAQLERGSIALPSGTFRELYVFRTIFGSPGSGKSTLLRQLARRYVAKGWTVVICDPADERDAPEGAHRARSVDAAAAFLHRRPFSVFMHGEASRKGVALEGHVHPWIDRLATERRHGGPSLYLATQVPTELDRGVRKCAGISFILWQSVALNLEWIKRNFAPEVVAAVQQLRDPQEVGRIDYVRARELGGK